MLTFEIASYMTKTRTHTTHMDLDYTKYTEQTLQLMHNEADKHLNALTNSFREITNKSYLLLGILISALTGLLGFMIKTDLFSIYSLFFLLLIIPTAQLIPNIKPSAFGFPGAEPQKMVHPYFENDTKNQYRKLLVQRIEDLQKMIDYNAAIIQQRSNQMMKAIRSIGIVLLLILILWLWSVIS
jgi:hypothetical protein